jgi:hypothetical protein
MIFFFFAFKEFLAYLFFRLLVGISEVRGLVLLELLMEDKSNPIVALFKLSFDLMFYILKGLSMRICLPFILFGLRRFVWKFWEVLKKLITNRNSNQENKNAASNPDHKEKTE